MRVAAVAVGAAVVLCVGGPAPAAAVTARWGWPLAAPHAITRGFVAPATPYGSGHRGIDIAGVTGHDVTASADGVVHFVGWVVDRPVVSVRHPDGLISSFEPVASALTAGELVVRGQVIGVLQEGHCPHACLHFGVRRYGEYVSPLLFLGGVPRSVLLPTRPLD